MRPSFSHFSLILSCFGPSFSHFSRISHIFHRCNLSPKHVTKAKDGSFALPLEAKLFSANKRAFEHTQSVIKMAREGTEADTEGLSEANTPKCAVDPLSLTVPIRVAFRLRGSSFFAFPPCVSVCFS